MMFSNDGKDPGEQFGSEPLALDVGCVKLFEDGSWDRRCRISVDRRLSVHIV